MTVWHGIDEPVLRWVADELPATLPPFRVSLTTRPDQPSEDVAGLTDRDVDGALQRLHSYGLVDYPQRTETIGNAHYNSIRLTALGHQVLGDWPDLDQVTAIEALSMTLTAIADAAPPERASVFRRAVGIIGEIGSAVVTSAATAEAGELGDHLRGVHTSQEAPRTEPER